jgi:adenine-specific DNA-methyltransferase
MLAQVDTLRREATKNLDQSKRSELGQFFTPYSIARFMASLFGDKEQKSVSVLDAGAGIGTLSIAVVERFSQLSPIHVELTAYELDADVSSALDATLMEFAQSFADRIRVNATVINADFILEGVMDYMFGRHRSFDFAILNPPYRKINSNSSHRLLLRKAGIETVNLYSGFLALSLLMLKEGGELVAIVPRSFCNGLYYRPFREFIFSRAATQQIHIFESRKKAFKDDEVLQENIIIHLVKGVAQGNVKVSYSTDDQFEDYEVASFPFERIVALNDAEKVIHIPTANNQEDYSKFENFVYSLSQLGIEVSTGPVVDFRVREHLHKDPIQESVPLIYPAHFNNKGIHWPKAEFKKFNAVGIVPETQKQFFPNGNYTLVRRFSSKEEKKRIVARVLTPESLPGEYVAFENHLNVFHQKKKGLAAELALGLAIYLNSTFVDEYFRQFNGHTQVNATDLRLLKYPSIEILKELGQWAENLPDFNQEIIDEKIASFL